MRFRQNIYRWRQKFEVAFEFVVILSLILGISSINKYPTNINSIHTCVKKIPTKTVQVFTHPFNVKEICSQPHFSSCLTVYNTIGNNTCLTKYLELLLYMTTSIGEKNDRFRWIECHIKYNRAIDETDLFFTLDAKTDVVYMTAI